MLKKAAFLTLLAATLLAAVAQLWLRADVPPPPPSAAPVYEMSLFSRLPGTFEYDCPRGIENCWCGDCFESGGPELRLEARAAEFVEVERLPVVSYRIDTEGNVSQVELLTSSGSGVLDQRVLQLIESARYHGGKKCQVKVKTSVDVVYTNPG